MDSSSLEALMIFFGIGMAGFLAIIATLFGGGKPSKGTKKDLRLKENKGKGK